MISLRMELSRVDKRGMRENLLGCTVWDIQVPDAGGAIRRRSENRVVIGRPADVVDKAVVAGESALESSRWDLGVRKQFRLTKFIK